jgi:hypothetical protein
MLTCIFIILFLTVYAFYFKSYNYLLNSPAIQIKTPQIIFQDLYKSLVPSVDKIRSTDTAEPIIVQNKYIKLIEKNYKLNFLPIYENSVHSTLQSKLNKATGHLKAVYIPSLPAHSNNRTLPTVEILLEAADNINSIFDTIADILQSNHITFSQPVKIVDKSSHLNPDTSGTSILSIKLI